MSFTIIVATDVNGGIGLFKDDKYSIPWKNSIDMQYFKDTTSCKLGKNAVIMGRNTYESLPVKKLPDRTNIVLTSNPSLINCPDVICESSLDSALNYCASNKLKPFVIGGSKLYEEALNDYRLETILWNVITETNEECNINFPISSIVEVKGDNAHEIFKWAKMNYGKSAVPKWNFYKILIGLIHG